MLTFTSTEPHSMFGGGASVALLVEPREFKILNGDDVVTFIYLHGDVEGKAGFDIPVIVAGEVDLAIEHEGTDCLVEAPPFEPTKCKLFAWFERDSAPKGRTMHGLIVACDDERALEYARKKFAERATRL